ncbi:MAG: hypothetical protein V4857_26435 [Pseudomonadota bacterium]
MRTFSTFAFGISFLVAGLSHAQKPVTMNPNDIQIGGYHHKTLPPALLKRIKATTDTFEPIDGLSLEKAVDLYKRDVNPEENLVLWEEMVRAYKIFCKARCSSPSERMDVYRSLLLRSMFSDQEALKQAKLTVLQGHEALSVMKLYRLPPKPIDVVQSK